MPLNRVEQLISDNKNNLAPLWMIRRDGENFVLTSTRSRHGNLSHLGAIILAYLTPVCQDKRVKVNVSSHHILYHSTIQKNTSDTDT